VLTDEQRKNRRKFLGGSDAAAAVGLSKWRSKYQLWDDKYNGNRPQLSDSIIEIMNWGSIHEKSIMDHGARLNGFELTFPDTIYHEKYPFLSANLDGFDERSNFVIEGKTASRYHGWGEPGTDQIPTDYLMQVAHYCAIKKAAGAHIWVLFQGSDFKQYIYIKNKDLEDRLIAAEVDFWEKHVMTGIAPPISTPEDGKLMYNLTDDSIIIADSETELIHREINEIDDNMRELKNRREKFSVHLMDKMRASECLRSESGKTLVTWKNQTRKSIDTTRVKKENPEIFEQYSKQTTSRVMRIKGV